MIKNAIKVQESAAAQYSRLEDLSQRLEALNPDLKGTAAQLFGFDNSSANSSQQSHAVNGQQSAPGGKHVSVFLSATF